MARRTVGWALLADAVPLYPLYALFFADTGLSDAEISGLFALWSTVSVLAEMPAGALADRFSRRGALVASGVLQAVGYAVWTAQPGIAGFASGFVLWGLSGALVSGALEALLYDALAAAGESEQFADVLGRVSAAGLLAQLPAAAAATVLYRVGGYVLVGWVSVGCCLLTAVLASRLPEERPSVDGLAREPETYLGTMRAGLAEVTASRSVRRAVLAVALLSGVDAAEEYFPLLAQDWGVPTALTPVALLSIPLAGAIGAMVGGRAARRSPRVVSLVVVTAALALLAAGLAGQPIGLAAIALGYGLYRLALVVVETRLQESIAGPARATVTSVAGLGVELTAILCFATWALGGVLLVALALALIGASLPRLLSPS